ncbi:MAG: SDR family NAD(P)-dependent oxidoreductase [Bacteroidales bacterium]|nr:SDR family NAD(P)-dependent oxidoreductase [Bacteroidales bacterium]
MDLKDKVILITGSTDGIGKETAKKVAEQGANLIIHGRIKQRVEATEKELSAICKNKVFGVTADFSNLREVSSVTKIIIEKYSKIDILFNNAADFFHDRSITKDGFEQTFQVNYLAHFLLTYKLLPLLKDVDETSKILNVTSMIHSSEIDFENLQGEKNYFGSSAYSLSKLLNILHTYKLVEVLSEEKTKANCLHPGVIETKLLNAAWSGGAPVSEGANTMLYAATSPVTEQMSGLYLENRRPVQSNPITYDKEIQNKLWDISLKMLKDYL